MIKKKNNRQCILFVTVNVVILVIMLAINGIYPYYWDDKGVVKDYVNGNWNIIDILRHSYERYYLHWSGKIVPLSIANIFTLLDKTIYNIVNSVMYIIFANVIYRFFWKKKYDYWMMIAIYAALWIFIPWFGTVVFWVDGTIEYMWMLIPVLVLGKIYYDNYFEINTSDRSSVLMIVLGLLAGCGLEATGSALVFSLCVMCVIKAMKKKSFVAWEICGIIGTVIGFAILMLAPGNYERASVVSELSGLYGNFLYRIARETYFFLLYMTPLLGLSVTLMFIQYRCTDLEMNPEQTLKYRLYNIWLVCRKSLVLVLFSLISVYVMTFTSAFSVRIFMTPTIVLVISCGIAISEIIKTDKGKALADKCLPAIRVMLSFICVFVIVQMATAFLFCLYTGEPITKNIQYTNILNDVRLFK